MTETNPTTQQLQQDLHFVRSAVEARDRNSNRSNTPVLLLWAGYSLFCIPMHDFFPRVAQVVNLAGFVAAMLISFRFGKFRAKSLGEFDRERVHRVMLHWIGGVVLLYVAVFGLANAHAGLTADGLGQLSVILVGFLYFTAGVHLPESRFMRWAGPVMILAGIAIGWLPHLRWTAIGILFALCLTAPILFGSNKLQAREQA